MDGGDIEMAAADDGASAPEGLDAMKKRLKEMEDEVAALGEMQAKVEKEMGAVQDPNAATVSQANKKEVDSRSIFVGNDINMDCENALWNGNIPLDLVKDILLRLPAKALGRCMCTCKRLYSLIKSTQFITSHLIHSKIRDNTLLIVQEGCYSIFSESDTTLIKQQSGRIPFPVMESDLYILGSCRGLLLVRLKVSLRDLVLLWNPLLEKFKLVDSIIHDRPHGNAHAVSSWLCVYGLGFHEASNDYRVVRITHGDVVDVYSFTNDNWHRVYETTNGKTLPSIANPTKMAIYVNGAVHWLASYNAHNLEENMVAMYDPKYERFVIMSFDFDIGFLKVIDLPPRRDCPYDYGFYALEVKEFNEKLALFGLHPSLGEVYYTWVMMNYPLVESWTNNGCLFKHGMDTVWPLVCTKKENCISKYNYAVKKDMLMYFNTKEDKIYELEVSAPYECPVIVDFVDNLVLLDVDNEVLEDHAL